MYVLVRRVKFRCTHSPSIRKCSKLKISHTAVIGLAARVAKQRGQRNSVRFVHKTVKVVPFPQTLLFPLLQVFRCLRQLNESSTASQEHDPTGSQRYQQLQHHLITKHHVFEYRRCCKNIFSLQQFNYVTIFFGSISNIDHIDFITGVFVASFDLQNGFINCSAFNVPKRLLQFFFGGGDRL